MYKKRAIFILSSYRIPFKQEGRYGGGEVSMHELIKHMNKSYDVRVITQSQYEDEGVYDFDHCKVRILNYKFAYGLGALTDLVNNWKWKMLLSKKISNINSYDIALVQGGLLPGSASMVQEAEVPSILFFRDYSNLYHFNVPGKHQSYIRYMKAVRDTLLYPFRDVMHSWVRKVSHKSFLNVSNSGFMKRKIKDYLDVNSKIVFPLIDTKKYITDVREKKYVTMARGKYEKGVDIFIKIAQRNQNISFLFAGEPDKLYKDRINKACNIRNLGWVEDMSRVYSVTKLMLVPSRWPEPFGRVAIEAMINGIPCVVSSNGGLPGIVGDAGVVIGNIDDINEWEASVTTLLEDEDKYDEKSRLSRSRAERFDANEQFKRIDGYIESVAS